VKSVVTAVGKGAWKGGSMTWGAVRKWYGATRELPKGTPVHHWLIEQNSEIGKNVPNWLKNQPWNLMPMESQAFHNAVHGWGKDAFNSAERVWHGTPDWAKVMVLDYFGKGVNAARPGEGDTARPNDCGCNE